MRARSVLTVLGAALGSAAGAVVLRRRTARRRERVELYFDDGSLVALTQGTDEAEPLLVHARELLAAARV
jgi:outer membrane lipoprotein SlyB